MISRTKTLKLIKEKVDGRTSRAIKLKRPLVCPITEGVIKHTTNRRITKLIKDGNSVMCIDDNYQQRNINVLETKNLHQIMWQVISENEKKEIALEHLVTSKTYLVEE